MFFFPLPPTYVLKTHVTDVPRTTCVDFVAYRYDSLDQSLSLHTSLSPKNLVVGGEGEKKIYY